MHISVVQYIVRSSKQVGLVGCFRLGPKKSTELHIETNYCMCQYILLEQTQLEVTKRLFCRGFYVCTQVNFCWTSKL